MSDPDHGFFSDRAKAFLTALKVACIAEGFDAPMEPALVAGQRWQATLKLRGRLGEFTLVLWTSWALLEYDGDQCRIDVLLGHEDLRTVYRCIGLEGFRADLEYVRLVIGHFYDAQDLAGALKHGANPRLRAEDRADFREKLSRLIKGTSTKRAGSA